MPSRPDLIRRGDVCNAVIPGVGTHPVVVVTRDSAIPVLSSLVCALVTSSFRGHVAEIGIGAEEGLDRQSAVNCDNLVTLPTAVLGRPRGRLGPVKIRRLDNALAVALGLNPQEVLKTTICHPP